MKITHITSVHPQNDNRIFYKECVTLCNAGHSINLIVAGGVDMVLNGVNIIGYQRRKGGRLTRIFKTSLFDMFKQCRKINSDIYHFHDPELIIIGLLLRALGKKVIYDIHENYEAAILSKSYIKYSLIKKVISKSFDIFEQLSTKFFTAIVSARPDISEKFIHKRLITLRNFPILSDLIELNNIKIEKKKPSVIYVGGISKSRGVNKLLDAFEELDEYELWLIGPIWDELLKKKIDAGCKNVRYFGIVEAYEIFSYIKKADIGIYTPFPEPNHVTTLPTKTFEYMACGKPMIMSNFEYWKNTFTRSSIYVNPADIKSIRCSIRTIINDKKLIEDMSKLNQKLSNDEYNWKKESKKLLQLYNKIEINV
jgi:glycosyltransferase involved in cell wall biosynthesis